jgi:ankyrin repeat protein
MWVGLGSLLHDFFVSLTDSCAATGMQILLAGGASVTARDEDDAVPLHDAAASGFPECVQLLLDAAARQGCSEEMLRATDVDGDTVSSSFTVRLGGQILSVCRLVRLLMTQNAHHF